MYKKRAEISTEKLLKVSTALLLCLLLVAVPFIERCHAVAAVDDIAILIIVTILLSMGISLVLGSSETPDVFLNGKYPSFKQFVGATEATLGAWLLADVANTAISLKDGILSIPKTVTTKAKQFISWLIPDPASNSVVDFSSGSVESLGIINVSAGSFNTNNQFVISSIQTKINLPFMQQLNNYYQYEDTSGVIITLRRTDPGGNISNVSVAAENAFDGTDLITRVNGETNANIRNDVGSPSGFCFCLQETNFIYNGVECLPGVYVCYFNWSDLVSNAGYIMGYRPTGSTAYVPICVMPLASVSSPDLSDQAIIGDYDDISGIRDVSKDISGTTVIENQFQITSAGQALNPSGESLDDIINALRQALENLNQKAEVMAMTDAVAEAGTISPDYGDFDLGQIDLSGLGALLTTRFPFCIPWDIGRIFGLFVADPEPPVWEFDLLPIDAFEGVDTTVTLDLGQYPIVGQISRWFCIIDLCIGLCYVTKRFVWVA